MKIDSRHLPVSIALLAFAATSFVMLRSAHSEPKASVSNPTEIPEGFQPYVNTNIGIELTVPDELMPPREYFGDDAVRFASIRPGAEFPAARVLEFSRFSYVVPDSGAEYYFSLEITHVATNMSADEVAKRVGVSDIATPLRVDGTDAFSASFRFKGKDTLASEAIAIPRKDGTVVVIKASASLRTAQELDTWLQRWSVMKHSLRVNPR